MGCMLLTPALENLGLSFSTEGGVRLKTLTFDQRPNELSQLSGSPSEAAATQESDLHLTSLLNLSSCTVKGKRESTFLTHANIWRLITQQPQHG